MGSLLKHQTHCIAFGHAVTECDRAVTECDRVFTKFDRAVTECDRPSAAFDRVFLDCCDASVRAEPPMAQSGLNDS
ncbi:MAG: hypothetical protein WBA76_09695 [Phormidesmis sp.]